MKKLSIAAALLLAFSAPSMADEKLRARLIGYQEVPSVSTVASGQFEAEIAQDEKSIDWTLDYSGLQGTVQQAHIHIAQRGVNGSIVIWLCETSTNRSPTPVGTCTPGSGSVGGRITAADVIAGSMAPQQLTANDLAEVIAAMRAGVAYANVHTNLSPGGEIRGQIRGRGQGGGRENSGHGR